MLNEELDIRFEKNNPMLEKINEINQFKYNIKNLDMCSNLRQKIDDFTTKNRRQPYQNLGFPNRFLIKIKPMAH